MTDDSQDSAANEANAQGNAAAGSADKIATKTSAAKHESKNAWISPLVLGILLLAIVSASRVYIGGPEGLMVVWKGGFSFDDTVVNIYDYANLPREQLERKPLLFQQMKDMDLLDPDSDGDHAWKKKRIRKNSRQNKTAPTPTEQESTSEKVIPEPSIK